MKIRTLILPLLLSCLPLTGTPALAAQKTPAAQEKVATVTASDKVNINTATLEQLTRLKGIGEKKAQAIIEYRDKQGSFTSVEQLAEVSGIGPATLDANRDMIVLK